MRSPAGPARSCPSSFSAQTWVVLLLVGWMPTVVSTQALQPPGADTDLQPYVGTWLAKFKGKTFLTIELKKQNGKLTGTVSHADFQVDKNGELTTAEQRDGSDPIFEAKMTNGMLRITIKEEDSQDLIQFEMKLTGTDQAELRILAPPDVPTPKPWKLERAKAVQ
jgi:hypothetical protein